MANVFLVFVFIEYFFVCSRQQVEFCLSNLTLVVFFIEHLKNKEKKILHYKNTIQEHNTNLNKNHDYS